MMYGFSGMEVTFERPMGVSFHSLVWSEVSIARRYCSVSSVDDGARILNGGGR